MLLRCCAQKSGATTKERSAKGSAGNGAASNGNGSSNGSGAGNGASEYSGRVFGSGEYFEDEQPKGKDRGTLDHLVEQTKKVGHCARCCHAESFDLLEFMPAVCFKKEFQHRGKGCFTLQVDQSNATQATPGEDSIGDNDITPASSWLPYSPVKPLQASTASMQKGPSNGPYHPVCLSVHELLSSQY